MLRRQRTSAPRLLLLLSAWLQCCLLFALSSPLTRDSTAADLAFALQQCSVLSKWVQWFPYKGQTGSDIQPSWLPGLYKFLLVSSHDTRR